MEHFKLTQEKIRLSNDIVTNENILSNPLLVDDMIVQEIEEICNKYKVPRRSLIHHRGASEGDEVVPDREKDGKSSADGSNALMGDFEIYDAVGDVKYAMRCVHACARMCVLYACRVDTYYCNHYIIRHYTTPLPLAGASWL